MNAASLTVYKSPFPKMRLGQDFDGGYITVDVPDAKYSVMLSGGVEEDVSFEEAFLEKYPGVKCLAFDGTIDKLPKENDAITFIKKNIGAQNDECVTNLHDIINSHDNIFVKMDIEGGEISWIKSLKYEQMIKFDQVVIEFHHPFGWDEVEVFDKFNDSHYLVHIHANNVCGVRDHGGVNVPNVFECTYLNKKYFTSHPQLNTDSLPCNIDMRNRESLPEIELNYYPFVN
jgi:hypothetical protein